MGNIIPLKNNLRFLVKTEWDKFASALGFESVDYNLENESLLSDRLMPLLLIFNQDFKGELESE